jgi:hypothetical protein
MTTDPVAQLAYDVADRLRFGVHYQRDRGPEIGGQIDGTYVECWLIALGNAAIDRGWRYSLVDVVADRFANWMGFAEAFEIALWSDTTPTDEVVEATVRFGKMVDDACTIADTLMERD